MNTSSHAPPRVLVWYWGTAGAGSRYALRVTEALAEGLGQEAIALCLHRDNPFFSETSRRASRVFAVEGAAGRSSPLGLLASLPGRAWAFAAAIRAFRPDVVVIPFPFALVWPLNFIARLAGSAIVIAVHDDEPHPGDYAPAFQRLTQRGLIRSASGIVTLSRYVAGRITPGLSERQRANLVALPLSAHVNPRTQNPRERGAGPVRFLFLGRMLRYKGLDILAEACAILADRDDWRLTLAGGGPETAMVQERFAGIAQVDLSLLRSLDEAEVDAQIAACDVLISPYTQASQSGVIAEACAFAVPSLVTPVGALPEQIAAPEGLAGWQAEAATGPALADAMRRAILDRGDYQARSAAALALARQMAFIGWSDVVRRSLV